MYVLIGDIGNTITKISVIESNTLKILKTIYFNTDKIFSKSFLKKTLKKIFKKEIFWLIFFFENFSDFFPARIFFFFGVEIFFDIISIRNFVYFRFLALSERSEPARAPNVSKPVLPHGFALLVSLKKCCYNHEH